MDAIHAGTPTPTDEVDFNRDVRPILVARCFACHGPDHSTRKRGLRLHLRDGAVLPSKPGREPALIPGDASSSRLIERVTDDFDPMPPEGERLTESEVETLRRWIDGGAEYKGHWSWEPIADPAPNSPTGSLSASVRNPIDAFLGHRMQMEGLEASGDATPAQQVRRLSYDLIGLPPDPAVVAAFEANPSDQAWERLVEAYLASPQFGERWGRHWLDLVRYAETAGHEYDYPIREAWRYRDYVIRAFNQDLPYDRFLKEHIAGDLMDPRPSEEDGTNESILGTGFWYFHQAVHGPTDVTQDQADRIANQLEVFGQGFIGLTISCARCHDHKFDAISTRDYYGLSGYMQSMRQGYAYQDPEGRITEAVARLQASFGASASEPKDHTSTLDAKTLAAYLEATVIANSKASESSQQASENQEKLEEQAAVPETSDPPARSTGNAPKEDLQAGSDGTPTGQASKQSNKPKTPVGWAPMVAKERNLDPKVLGRWISAFASPEWKSPHHPWNPWFQLAMEGVISEEGPRNSAIHAHLLYPNDKSEYLETFDPSGPTLQWFDAGWAWSSPNGEILCTPQGTLQSDSLDNRLQGTLRSETFVLDKTALHWRVRGTAATSKIRLVVEGMRMDEFNAVLFSGYLQSVETHDGWRHVFMNTELHQGKRAHLELIDDGPGRLEVDAIWTGFADKDAPLGYGEAAWIEAARTGDKAKFAMALAQLALSTESESPMDAPNPKRLALEAQPLRRALALNGLMGTNAAEADMARKAAQADFIRNQKTQPELASPRRALTAIAGNPVDTHVYLRGSPKQLGEIAERRFIDSISAMNDTPTGPKGSRLALADSLFVESNPLTARVMANRVWHHLFGKGLVATTDDFGGLGSMPTHPDLLDHLANRFRSSWSIKDLIRYVVRSSAYRRSTTPVDPGTLAQIDPENNWLSKARLRRLQAEAIRDAMLATSGRLDLIEGGPSVATHLTGFMNGRGRPGAGGPLDGEGRRSVYLEVRRNFANPMLAAFDLPVPSTTTGRRNTSNVPAQSLVLLNDPFVHAMAKLWAEKARADKSLPDNRARLGSMWREAYSETPTDADLAPMIAFLRQGKGSLETWTDIAHAIYNSKAFLYLN